MKIYQIYYNDETFKLLDKELKSLQIIQITQIKHGNLVFS